MHLHMERRRTFTTTAVVVATCGCAASAHGNTRLLAAVPLGGALAGCSVRDLLYWLFSRWHAYAGLRDMPAGLASIGCKIEVL